MKESRYNIWLEPINGKHFCYNAVTSGFAQIEPEAMILIEKMKSNNQLVSDLSESEKKGLEELRRGCILVNDSEDELSKLILRNKLTAFGRSHILSLTILPTLKCNLSCSYCFESNKEKSMDDSTANKIIESLENRIKAGDLKAFAVNWFGGEPLIEYERIVQLSERFIEICSKHNICYHADMVSNCTLLDEEKAKKLVDCGIQSIQVTLDGSKEIHDKRRKTHTDIGTFDKIINVIDKCSKYISFAIRVNLSQGCQNWFDEFFHQIKHLAGRQNISIYPGKLLSHVTSACSSIESSCYNAYEFSQIAIEFHKKTIEFGFGLHWYPKLVVSGCCATSVNAMTIQPDGSLCRCWSQVGVAEESYGNINESETSFNPENYYKWVLYDIHDYNNKCYECIYFPLCAGSCPANWIPQTTDYMKGNNNIPDEDKCCSIRYNLKQMLNIVYKQSNNKEKDVKDEIY